MSDKRRRIYFVVNEGDIVFASYDEDAVKAKAEELRVEAIKYFVEEAGRDIDDLTPAELIEFGIYAGANGGYYYTASVKEPKDRYAADTFDTDEGDTIMYLDLMEYLDGEDACAGD